MVGSELPTPETAESTVTDRPVIEVENLTVHAAGASLGEVAEASDVTAPAASGGTGAVPTAPTDADVRRVLDDVTFTIHAGEVMGIAGVEGNGQTELIDALIGTRHADSGTLRFLGEDITPWPTRRRREQGVGYIPEDRHRQGLLLEAPSGRTASSATSPRSPTPRASGWTPRAPRPTPAGSSRSTTSAPRHRRHRRLAVRRQPAEADRRPRDEPLPQVPDRRAPHPRCGRRRAGADLGPHPRGPPRGPGGAADLRRPRRADRPVGHPAGDLQRPPRRRRRPGHHHPRGTRLRHDRRRGGHLEHDESGAPSGATEAAPEDEAR